MAVVQYDHNTQTIFQRAKLPTLNVLHTTEKTNLTFHYEMGSFTVGLISNKDVKLIARMWPEFIRTQGYCHAEQRQRK